MRTLFPILALCFAAPALAETPDFVTGRPGRTESPISTPQGHLQIESELASYARGEGAESWSAAATTFRYGVAHGADVELVVAPYLRTRADGKRSTASVT